MERQHRTLAVCFGAISALGPLALDMYLAAMPAMMREFAVDARQIERTVMAFFVGFCLGQLVMGPVSDRAGRKPVVIAGLVLFCVASAGCMLATSVAQLSGWRILQGVGGSVGLVIAMASIRDLFAGAAAARLLSLVVMVLGLAPVIAPVAGSMLLSVLPWRAIFAVLMALSAAVLLVVIFLMPETRSPQARKASSPWRAPLIWARLLRRGDYIVPAGAMALGQGGFFGYISVASLVLMTIYGLSPLQFSAVFAANALALALASQLGGLMVGRHGPRKVARAAILFRAVVAVVLAVAAFCGLLTLPVFVGLFFLLIASLGFVMPACSVMALEHQAQDAGVASALMGALGFGAGAAVTAITGLMADGTAGPISLAIAATALLSLAIGAAGFRKQKPAAA